MSSSDSSDDSKSDNSIHSEKEDVEEEGEVEEFEFKGKVSKTLSNNTNFANGLFESKDNKILTANESDGAIHVWKKEKILKKVHQTNSHLLTIIEHSKGYLVSFNLNKSLLGDTIKNFTSLIRNMN